MERQVVRGCGHAVAHELDGRQVYPARLDAQADSNGNGAVSLLLPHSVLKLRQSAELKLDEGAMGHLDDGKLLAGKE